MNFLTFLSINLGYILKKRFLAVLTIKKFIGVYSKRVTFSQINEGDMTILALKIAHPMSYLHSHSVVHCNLIPMNIYDLKK